MFFFLSFNFFWSPIYVFFITCDFDAISKKPYPKPGLCLFAPCLLLRVLSVQLLSLSLQSEYVPMSGAWRGWEGVESVPGGSRKPGSCFTVTAFCTSFLILQVCLLIYKMGQVLILLVYSLPSAPVRMRIKWHRVYGDSWCTQDH